MRRILAIEADSRRQRVLSTLVLDHVKADLIVVPSVQAAISSIVGHVPDLILVPALLSPADEAELLSHMKQLDSAPYIQMLTVPALDMLTDAPVESTGWRGLLGPIFSRRPVSLGLQYDSRMVAAQIVDRLERARELRIEYARMLAYNEAGLTARVSTLVPERSASSRGCERRSFGVLATTAAVLDDQPRDHVRDERRVARRSGRGDVPWLSVIRLSWGPELQLINISSSGVLVESGSKFTPGSTTDLCFSGPETDLVVPVRFIRSDVARIDGLGVRYQAAATFARTVDLNGPPRDAPGTSPQALAGLLAAVLANANRSSEPAQFRFAQGLRELVGARDVQVRTGSTSTGSPGGLETLFFDVPGDDRLHTTMQVTFDRNHDVTAGEFKFLKAAAWLTAVVLELDESVSQPVSRPAPIALIPERVA